MRNFITLFLALVFLLSLTESAIAQSIGFYVGGGSSKHFVRYHQGRITAVHVGRSDSSYYLDEGDQHAKFLLSMIVPVGVLMALGILFLFLLVLIFRGFFRSFRGGKVNDD